MRRNGKTTRLVDNAVEYFFNNNIIVLYENYDKQSTFLDSDAILHDSAQRYFISTLIKRLESEHYGQYEVIKEKGSKRIEIRRV